MAGTRRRRWLVAMASVCAAAACGDDGSPAVNVAAAPPVAVKLADRAGPDPATDPAVAGKAIAAFGTDLLAAVVAAAPPGDNVIVSPASVAIALALLEPGTNGDAQAALRTLLRIDEPESYHASMNALEQLLEARVAGTAAGTADEPFTLMDGSKVTSR